MYVKVLCDEKAKRGLQPSRGFACLLNNRVLFDTAEDPSMLLDNMKHMMVDPARLDAVVVSHEHWDHTGGLWEILRMNPGIKVYACPSFSNIFKECVNELGRELIMSEGSVQVAENVFTTGEMMGEYKEEPMPEQALVVKGDSGVSIITGCAHPGILRIVEKVKKDFDTDEIYLVFGGFHIGKMDREDITRLAGRFKELKVQKVGPSHCSGMKARMIFRGKYLSGYVGVKAGHIIHL
ncbi:MAG: MBL fold metallo-hydrolase [Candidatus Omnitrophica bacterium]|nr:MBL fold metallo-hydrolase [Candidatus Omnitrophota bacterium]MDD5489013.1 MBL fold metallo-hydrolase [Candidatus Omnitrophota bacterium]